MFVARLFLASHYVFSGLEGIVRHNDAVGFATAFGIPFAQYLIAPACAIDLIGAACLFTTRWRRPAAIVLGLWTPFLGVWFHRFWSVPAELWQPTIDDFFHHFVMFGAFIYVAVVGADPIGVGSRQARPAAA